MDAPRSYEFVHAGIDGDVQELLRAAVAALTAEDTAFKTAFAKARKEDEDFYRPANHGLCYWVFETQLVYTIFKSWIPLARVAWESPAYRDARCRADIAVFQGVNEKQLSMVFEAKWWNRDWRHISKQKKTLDDDIRRLLQKDAAVGRYVMAFWWTTEAELCQDDRKEVDDYCRDLDTRGLAKAELVFLDGFRTDWTPDRGKTRHEDGLFVLAALRVDK